MLINDKSVNILLIYGMIAAAAFSDEYSEMIASPVLNNVQGSPIKRTLKKILYLSITMYSSKYSKTKIFNAHRIIY